MPTLSPHYELHEECEPLTDTEIKWLKKLERVLKDCPSDRIALQTIGDPDLAIIDAKLVKKFDFDTHDGLAGDHGVELARIDSKPPIWGVTG